jgi:uncharacterized membrane protein YtjA (UPF0391 family)
MLHSYSKIDYNFYADNEFWCGSMNNKENLARIFNYHFQIYFMLKYAVIFFVIAIIAAIFGFTGIAAGAASIAKVLFYIFIVLFLLAIIFGAKVFGK